MSIDKQEQVLLDAIMSQKDVFSLPDLLPAMIKITPADPDDKGTGVDVFILLEHLVQEGVIERLPTQTEFLNRALIEHLFTVLEQRPTPEELRATRDQFRVVGDVEDFCNTHCIHFQERWRRVAGRVN